MQTSTNWNIFQKFGFRFFFSYAVLSIFPFPLNSFSFLSDLTRWFDSNVWGKIVVLLGDLFFNLELTGERVFTGSGDTTHNFVVTFSQLFIAVIIAIIWSIFDRKRQQYTVLLKFLVVYIAYYVMYAMLSYGSYKIIPLQFPAPSLGRLIQPYGESSPMGIAWTFMGASSAYTIFSGLAEVIGGILLIFRRTRTLGGLVCFGVMLNIFMMNMCYDIPVKIYSFHLMLFSFFIFMQDRKRIFAVFFTKATTIPRSFPHYFKKRAYNIAATVVKVLLIGFFFYSTTVNMIASNESRGPNAPKPYMHGIYDVTSIVKNNDTIPLLITDESIWKRFVIQRKGYMSLYSMKDKGTWYTMKLDSVAKTIRLEKRSDSADIFNLKYSLKDSILTLAGTHRNDTILIKAKQYDLTKFRLINRGFHWINEHPYNR